jgi:sugar-specific transcriptional regulator TrmB
MDLVACLIETGLTRHEAQIYLLLCAEGVMSGYEAAKQSGISRSNAYIALTGLSGKGAAMILEGDVRRYAAVSPTDYCQNKDRHFAAVLATIREQMPARREAAEPFLTIKGEQAILDQMRSLLHQVEHRVYLALAEKERQEVLPELERLCALGRKVVLITPPPFSLTGATVHHAPKQPGQIRLIADSSLVLTGEIGSRQESSCLYSRHPALVDLFKESMANEIRLIGMNPARNDGRPQAEDIAERKTQHA